MKDKLLDKTYQGRKQYASVYNQSDFNEFIASIAAPEEWAKWKITIEGELVTTLDAYTTGLQKLAKGKSVIMVDQVNKIIYYLSKELYELNLDKK